MLANTDAPGDNASDDARTVGRANRCYCRMRARLPSLQSARSTDNGDSNMDDPEDRREREARDRHTQARRDLLRIFRAVVLRWSCVECGGLKEGDMFVLRDGRIYCGEHASVSVARLLVATYGTSAGS